MLEVKRCIICNKEFQPKNYCQLVCCKECRNAYRRKIYNEQHKSNGQRQLFFDSTDRTKKEKVKKRRREGYEWLSKFDDIIELQLKTGKSYGELQREKQNGK